RLVGVVQHRAAVEPGDLPAAPVEPVVVVAAAQGRRLDREPTLEPERHVEVHDLAPLWLLITPVGDAAAVAVDDPAVDADGDIAHALGGLDGHAAGVADEAGNGVVVEDLVHLAEREWPGPHRV